jgi:hypothetical protein
MSLSRDRAAWCSKKARTLKLSANQPTLHRSASGSEEVADNADAAKDTTAQHGNTQEMLVRMGTQMLVKLSSKSKPT